MQGLRKFMQDNPMLGWALASVFILAAAVMIYMRITHKSETLQLTELITIRCSETGYEWQVPRGVMEKELYLRPYPVDPNQGLINPKTGKATGFPVDAWKQTVDRVNAERNEDVRPAAAAPPVPAPSPGR
jgi:apolipoprotein N-acyltransferase